MLQNRIDFAIVLAYNIHQQLSQQYAAYEFFFVGHFCWSGLKESRIAAIVRLSL